MIERKIDKKKRGRSCVRMISTTLDKRGLGFVGSIDIRFMIKKKLKEGFNKWMVN